LEGKSLAAIELTRVYHGAVPLPTTSIR